MQINLIISEKKQITVLKQLIENRQNKATKYNEVLKLLKSSSSDNDISKEPSFIEAKKEYTKARDKLSAYKRKIKDKKETEEEKIRKKRNQLLCEKIKQWYMEKTWKEISITYTTKWKWWWDDWFWYKKDWQVKKESLANYDDLTNKEYEELALSKLLDS